MTGMSLDTQPYKGVRDFYPEDMAVENYIFGQWRKVAESFGYVEYGASILEPAELYKNKTSEEIVNEQTFIFKDRGGREIVLRPEMTPTLARMVAARRKSLKFPLRWYSIPNVFRYERPQRGRKREHWQLNCDLVGQTGVQAEAEIISLAHAIMKSFGAKDSDFEIRVNSRKLLQKTYTKLLEDKVRPEEMFRLLDRKDKMEKDKFEAEWQKLFGSPFQEPDSQSDQELSELIKELERKGIKTKFAPSLTRGFDYYTGMVFEVFDTDSANNRSLFGGGRYDNLLQIFGVEAAPTVGFGMGDITIRDFLETHKLPLCEK